LLSYSLDPAEVTSAWRFETPAAAHGIEMYVPQHGTAAASPGSVQQAIDRADCVLATITASAASAPSSARATLDRLTGTAFFSLGHHQPSAGKKLHADGAVRELAWLDGSDFKSRGRRGLRLEASLGSPVLDTIPGCRGVEFLDIVTGKPLATRAPVDAKSEQAKFGVNNLDSAPQVGGLL